MERRKSSVAIWTYGHPNAQEGDTFVLYKSSGGDALILKREESENSVRFLIAPGGDVLFNRQWTEFFPLHVPPHLRRHTRVL